MTSNGHGARCDARSVRGIRVHPREGEPCLPMTAAAVARRPAPASRRAVRPPPAPLVQPPDAFAPADVSRRRPAVHTGGVRGDPAAVPPTAPAPAMSLDRTARTDDARRDGAPGDAPAPDACIGCLIAWLVGHALPEH